MLKRLGEFSRAFISVTDHRVKKILFTSLLIGVALFICEYCFIISLQGFLAALEITTSEKLSLPEYYPKSFEASLLIFLTIALLKIFFQSLKVFLSNFTSQIFAQKQREKIIKFSLHYFPFSSTHEIVSLFTDTLGRASTAIMEINGLVVSLTTTFILTLSGFYLAPKEMALGLCIMIVLVIPLKIFNHLTHTTGHEINEVWKSVNKKFIEGMKHNFFIRIHGLVDEYNEKGINALEKYKSLYTRYFLSSGIKNSLPVIIGILVICIISYSSKYFFHTDAGKLIAFLYIFIRFAQGASEVSGAINSISVNTPGLIELDALKTKMISLEKLSNTRNEKLSSQEKTTELNKIEFQNIEFFYEKSDPLLKNINFKLSRSDVLLIRGASGTGKSTIISLLTGMLTPASGSILINDKNLNEVNLAHEIISYVGPEPFTFEDTIRNNLLLGNSKKNISDNEILEAIKIAAFDTVLVSSSKDLNFKLNETTQLSTGQKQRLSLARAILRKPQLLILDESTANLDNETEQIIVENLKKIFPKIITIIIGHKSNFDNIATLTLDLNQPKK